MSNQMKSPPNPKSWLRYIAMILNTTYHKMWKCRQQCSMGEEINIGDEQQANNDYWLFATCSFNSIDISKVY